MEVSTFLHLFSAGIHEDAHGEGGAGAYTGYRTFLSLPHRNMTKSLS